MHPLRVGIIGAGQLGRMMALAAYPLGIGVHFLDRRRNSPGGQIGPIDTAELDDAGAILELGAKVDVVTLDIENVPTDSLAALARRVPVRPGADVVAIAQDRLAEKRIFRELGIPTAPFVSVDSDADLRAAPARLGWPIVLKARRLGYDGRGQRIASSAAELKQAWASLNKVPALAEGWVRFDRELSLIAVQSGNDDQAFYGLCENRHENGILVETIAPHGDAQAQQAAEHWAGALLRRFDYRGVLAIEFFQTGGELVANEMAPRVHNSGHWTIEGAETSQFENHIRAIVGWPLGDTAARGHAAMINLLGRMPDPAHALAVRGVHLHDYGKTPRPARKLGHLTIVDSDPQRLRERLEVLRGAANPARQ